MKRVAAILVIALAAAGCGDDDNGNPAGPSNTGPITFTAQLSAANEVPPVTGAEANARGTATIVMDVPRDSSGTVTGPGTVNISVQVNSFPPGTPAILAHIHTGSAGATGSPIVNTNLTPATAAIMGDGTANLTFTNLSVTQANAAAIVANPAGHYFNLHTQANPGGAVRGQLVRQ